MIYFQPTTWLILALVSSANYSAKLKKISKMVAVVASIAMRSEKQIHFAALDGRWFGVDESYPSHMKVTPVDGMENIPTMHQKVERAGKLERM